MGHYELNLEQLLADPLIRLVMSSDDVHESDIRNVMKRVKPNPMALRSNRSRSWDSLSESRC